MKFKVIILFYLSIFVFSNIKAQENTFNNTQKANAYVIVTASGGTKGSAKYIEKLISLMVSEGILEINSNNIYFIGATSPKFYFYLNNNLNKLDRIDLIKYDKIKVSGSTADGLKKEIIAQIVDAYSQSFFTAKSKLTKTDTIRNHFITLFPYYFIDKLGKNEFRKLSFDLDSIIFINISAYRNSLTNRNKRIDAYDRKIFNSILPQSSGLFFKKENEAIVFHKSGAINSGDIKPAYFYYNRAYWNSSDKAEWETRLPDDLISIEETERTDTTLLFKLNSRGFGFDTSNCRYEIRLESDTVSRRIWFNYLKLPYFIKISKLDFPGEKIDLQVKVYKPYFDSYLEIEREKSIWQNTLSVKKANGFWHEVIQFLKYHYLLCMFFIAGAVALFYAIRKLRAYIRYRKRFTLLRQNFRYNQYNLKTTKFVTGVDIFGSRYLWNSGDRQYLVIYKLKIGAHLADYFVINKKNFHNPNKYVGQIEIDKLFFINFSYFDLSVNRDFPLEVSDYYNTSNLGKKVKSKIDQNKEYQFGKKVKDFKVLYYNREVAGEFNFPSTVLYQENHPDITRTIVTFQNLYLTEIEITFKEGLKYFILQVEQQLIFCLVEMNRSFSRLLLFDYIWISDNKYEEILNFIKALQNKNRGTEFLFCYKGNTIESSFFAPEKDLSKKVYLISDDRRFNSPVMTWEFNKHPFFIVLASEENGRLFIKKKIHLGGGDLSIPFIMKANKRYKLIRVIDYHDFGLRTGMVIRSFLFDRQTNCEFILNIKENYIKFKDENVNL